MLDHLDRITQRTFPIHLQDRCSRKTKLDRTESHSVPLIKFCMSIYNFHEIVLSPILPGFIAFSTMPEVAQRIKMNFALGPVISFKYPTSIFTSFFLLPKSIIKVGSSSFCQNLSQDLISYRRSLLFLNLCEREVGTLGKIHRNQSPWGCTWECVCFCVCMSMSIFSMGTIYNLLNSVTYWEACIDFQLSLVQNHYNCNSYIFLFCLVGWLSGFSISNWKTFFKLHMIVNAVVRH